MRLLGATASGSTRFTPRIEPLEQRRLLAADLYVDDFTAADITTDVDPFELLSIGDEVTWVRGDTQVALIYGTDAFSSLQTAIDEAAAGDTIYISDGEYAGLVVSKDLTLDALGGTATVTGASPALTVEGGAQVTIDGLALTDTSADSLGAIVVRGDDGGDEPVHSMLTLRNSTVSGHQTATDPLISVLDSASADLGTDSDSGGNTLSLTVSGAAFIDNQADNALPFAGDTFEITTSEDTAFDVDVRMDSSSVQSITLGGTHGSVSINVDGSLHYMPAQDYNGPAAFGFSLLGGSGTVDITVTPVNDAPTVDVNIQLVVDEGGSATITGSMLDTNDVDNTDAEITYTVKALPAAGTLMKSDTPLGVDGEFTQADVEAGAITFMHDGSEDPTGADADGFTFDVSDGSLTVIGQEFSISVTRVNDNDPTAVDDSLTVDEGGTAVALDGGAESVLDNDPDADLPYDTLSATLDVDVEHGDLTLNADGTFTYTHDGTEVFTDSFTYVVEDDNGGVTDTGTVTITINPVNDNAPVVGDKSLTVAEGGTATTLDGGETDLAADATDVDEPDTLTFSTTPVVAPAHGEVLLNANGTFTYTHDGGEETSDSFVVEVLDAEGHSGTATISIAITPVNDAPTLDTNAGLTVDEGDVNVPIGSDLLEANDVDNLDADLTYTLTDAPSAGTLKVSGVALNVDGTFTQDDLNNNAVTYDHDDSENFSDSFGFDVSDGSGGSVTGQVFSISIAPVNDETPVANDDATEVAEGGSGSIIVLTNDTDLDDPYDELTVVGFSDPSHGTLTLNEEGVFEYTHDGSENLLDSFTYDIEDAAAHAATATVSITITPFNDNDPVAEPDSYTIEEGGTLTITEADGVLANDTDIDLPNDVLTVTVDENVSHGALTLELDGSFIYIHDGTENFSDSFTYVVTDENGGVTSTGTVDITITPVNDNDPVAVLDNYTIDEGGTLSITDPLGETTPDDVGDDGVLANDTDVDLPNDELWVELGDDVQHGQLALNGDGTFEYIHDDTETFVDSFTYVVWDADDGPTSTGTVTITVNSVNDNDPVAADDSITVDEGDAVAVLDGGAASVLDNDSDGDADAQLTASVDTVPQHGELTLNDDGTFSYTHDGSENFSDSFTYTLADESGVPADTGLVTIIINAVNDNNPVAVDDTITLNEGATATVVGGGAASVLANDSDVDLPHDALTVTLASGPSHGDLTLNDDGTFSYTHDGSENSSDSFTYNVTDAESHTALATVSISITLGNDLPTVDVNDGLTLAEGETETITDSMLAVSDTDNGPEEITFTLTSGPANGELLLDGTALAEEETFTQEDINTGLVTYSHDGSENLSDGLTLNISDGNGGTIPAETFVITVTPVNDNDPVAADDSITLDEGATTTALDGGATSVLGNDSDVDLPEDALTATVLTGPTHGSLTLNADGTFEYTHNDSENFVDSFTYKLADADGGAFATATVTITINAVNDNDPVAGDDAITVDAGGAATVLDSGETSVLANDSDGDTPHDVLSAALVTAPKRGTVNLQADGTFVYTHNGSNHLTDSFTYAVSDADGGVTDVGTVSIIAISPVNQPPVVAVNEGVTLAEGSTATVTSADLDVQDPDNSAAEITIEITSWPSSGTLNLSGTPLATDETFTQADINSGDLTYVHDDSEGELDEFTFEASDPDGLTVGPETVIITLTPVNDNDPVAADDSVTVDEGDAVAVLDGGATSVLDNDSDVDPGAQLTASVGTLPQYGELTLNDDGTFSYTHDGSENFSDSFTYTLADESGVPADTGLVTIVINAVNDNDPVAVDDIITLDEGAMATVVDGGAASILANDSDVDLPLDVLTVSLTGDPPAHGSLTLNSDGTFSYTHNGSENFADGFSYTVTDADGGVTATASVSIVINSLNDAPVLSVPSGPLTAEEDVALTISGIAVQDSDAADADMTLDLVVAHGSLTVGTADDVTIIGNGTSSISLTGSQAAINGLMDGGVVYLGEADFNTVDGSPAPTESLTVTSTDGGHTGSGGVQVNSASLEILVGEVNDPPQVTVSVPPVMEDSLNNVFIVTDLADPGAVSEADQTVTLVGGTGATYGAVSFDLIAGTISYSPAPDFAGTDQIMFTIRDDGTTAGVNDFVETSVTMDIEVTPLNDSDPVAVDDSIVVDEGGSTSVGEGGIASILDNDLDGDLPYDTLSAVQLSSPEHGSIVDWDSDGTFTYVHDGTETLLDSFMYGVLDADGGATSTGMVYITINLVNDHAPVAIDESISVDEGGIVTELDGGALSVLANDSDGDIDDELTASVDTDPQHGTLVLNADGTFSYTHNGSENFTDSFTYIVTDQGEETATATVEIVIAPVNENDPLGVDDAVEVAEGGTVTVLVDGTTASLLANDTDEDLPNDALTVNTTPLVDVANGSLTLSADGNFEYVHDGSETLTDSFTYELSDAEGHTSSATVSISVIPVNDSVPTAGADAITVTEDGTAALLDSGATSVLANDTDDDLPNDDLTVSVDTAPMHGELVLQPNGEFTYVHDGSEVGTDGFTYVVSDLEGHTALGTVTITVNLTNDIPAVDLNAGLTVTEGSTDNAIDASNLHVFDADNTDAEITYELTAGPAHGEVKVSGASSTTFTQQDLLDGLVTYDHDDSEIASDAFTFSVSDGDKTITGQTFDITVLSVNDNLPVAVDDDIAVAEGETALQLVSGATNVLANDTDDDLPNDTLTATVEIGPDHGTLLLLPDGTFWYTHDGSESSTDAFSYTVSDAVGNTSTASVDIAITLVNDPPILTANTGLAINEGDVDVVIGSSELQTSDAESDAADIVYTVVAVPTSGTLRLSDTALGDGDTFTQENVDSGELRYDHDDSETFADGFTFDVTDGAATIAGQQFAITIAPVNDQLPVGLPDSIVVDEGGTATTLVVGVDEDESASVLDNDSDGDIPDSITASLDTPPAHGALTLNPDGTFSYTHDGSESPSDTFVYQVVDEAGQTDAVTVSITINPVNDEPVVAVNAPLATSEGDAFAVIDNTLLATTDADNTPAELVYSLTTVTSNGVLRRFGVPLGVGDTFSQEDLDLHAITYDHDGGETTADSFLFDVSDGVATVSGQTFSITVALVNDNAPVATGDAITAPQGRTVTVLDSEATSLLANDTDADLPNDTLTANTTPVVPPEHGELVLNADGTFSYTHDGSENLADNFTYEVSDEAGNLATATVDINVTLVFEPPAVDINTGLTIAEGDTATAVDDSVLKTVDADTADGDLIYTVTGVPAAGSLQREAVALVLGDTFTQEDVIGALLTYDHDGSETFADGFTFDVTDGTTTIADQTFAIVITPVNDNEPVAVAGDDQTIIEADSISVDASASSDLDLPNDTLTFEWDFGDPNAPDPVTGATATHTYADDGTFTVTLTVSDEAGHTQTDTLIVTVDNVDPIVDAGIPDVSVAVGAPLVIDGSFTDPGLEEWTATVDFGEGAGSVPLTLSGQQFTLDHVYATPGAYTITVTVDDGDGGIGTDTVAVDVIAGEVVGRHVFYNASAFDWDETADADGNGGYNAGEDGSNDADAVALDKQALLPGEMATFANYTSYSAGLNGIMVDVAGLPAETLTDVDFLFGVGNDNEPGEWDPAPTPQSITVQEGAGVAGSDRVVIVWADNAIQQQWLQATVVANANTGLLQNDVFYFGNAIGESGNSGLEALVNTTDEIGARNNPHFFLDPAAVDDAYDYNRDMKVDTTDEIIARTHATYFMNALRLITVPSEPAPLPAPPQSAGEGRLAVDEVLSNERPSRDAWTAQLAWLLDIAEASDNQSSVQEDDAADAVDLVLAMYWR